MAALERLQHLEQTYLGGVKRSARQSCSIETLLDVLVVLYDECCNSTLRREKSISDFVDYGKPEFIPSFCWQYQFSYDIRASFHH